MKKPLIYSVFSTIPDMSKMQVYLYPSSSLHNRKLLISYSKYVIIDITKSSGDIMSTVLCAKYNKELPALDKAPFPDLQDKRF